jgi:hypothetical protein
MKTKNHPKMYQYITECDMRSIKIFNDTMSVFFMNNIGDMPNTVKIYPKKIDNKTWDFLGHFTVRTQAFLSHYDCTDTPVYEFKKGRWFVYLEKDSIFHIIKNDMDIHA